jgi:alpha/beta superfamily hydrolase
MRNIFFTCEMGKREAKYYTAKDPNAPTVLVLHPHPLHGGTMNNKVVYRLFHTFVNNGFSAMRFNFRGVGKSHGVFDHGVGELIDATTALDWLQNNNPDVSNYWIAGFSFGAWVGLQLVMRRPEVKGFVMISPPANSYDFSFLSPCPVSGCIVQGTNDLVVPEHNVAKLVDQISVQPNIKIQYNVINKADHFFTNKLDEMESVVDKYIKSEMHNIMQDNKISKKDKHKLIAELPIHTSDFDE